jgi:hypothetical protein
MYNYYIIVLTISLKMREATLKAEYKDFKILEVNYHLRGCFRRTRIYYSQKTTFKQNNIIAFNQKIS